MKEMNFKEWSASNKLKQVVHDFQIISKCCAPNMVYIIGPNQATSKKYAISQGLERNEWKHFTLTTCSTRPAFYFIRIDVWINNHDYVYQKDRFNYTLKCKGIEISLNFHTDEGDD